MKEINITFNSDGIMFNNYSNLVEHVYNYLHNEKESYLKKYYEHTRYFFKNKLPSAYNDIISLTSKVSFKDRIRFYQKNKLDQPIEFFVNILWDSLNNDEHYNIAFKNIKQINETDSRLLNKLIIRYLVTKPQNILITLDGKKIEEEITITSRNNEFHFITPISDNSEYILEKFKETMSMGFHEDAIKLGNLYLERYDSKDAFIRQHLGLAYVFNGYPKEGEQEYRKILIESNNPIILANIYYCMSMLYTRHHFKEEIDYQKAFKYLKLGQEVIDNSEESLKDEFLFLKIFNRNGQALIEFKNNDYEKAHNYCDDGQRKLFYYYGNKKHLLHRTVIMYNCTITTKKLKRYNETKLYFDMLLSLDPYYTDYWYDKAKFHSKLNQQQEMKITFEKLLSIDPYSSMFTLAYAIELDKIRDYKNAEIYYLKALELDPSNSDLLLNYTAFLYNQKKFKEAKSLYLKYQNTTILKNECLINITSSLIEENDLELAEKILKHLLQTDLERVEVFMNLAIIEDKCNRLNSALNHIEKALVIEPYNEILLENKEYLEKNRETT